MITENISTLEIHRLTQAQYDRELSAGTLRENAIYLTPNEESDLSLYAKIEQLDTKADLEHTHEIEDINQLQEALDEINQNKADSAHTHTVNDVDNLNNVLSGKVDTSAFDEYKNTIETSKADAGHKHVVTDITDLQTTLDSNLASAKSYTDTQITNKVGTTSVATQINNHNTSNESHNDIRVLITNLTTKLNNFLNVDDTTTDQLSEVLALIEANRGTLDSLTTNKVNVSDIIDNLTTAVSTKVLSANQGVAIKTLIDNLQSALDNHTDNTTKHITAAERTQWNAAEPNQNAFTNVVVGSTTIAADSKTDTLTIAAGTGVSITPDATNDKVTITNSGVRSIATGSTNGTISVNTNGTSADVAVKGLGSAAYTASTAYDTNGAANTALESAKSYTDTEVAKKADKSTTLGGYGITDAYTQTEVDTSLSNKQDTVTGAATSITSSNLTANRALLSNGSGKVAVSDITSTELGYLDGVTSNIQTQLNSKQSTITGGATSIASSNLTASRALVSDNSGKVAVSDVTSTELGYLDGVTSNIQTQLDGKAASSHNHSASNITSGTLSSDRLPIMPVNKGGTGSMYPEVALENLGGMSASHPTGTGSFSLNRQGVSGDYSVAIGFQSTAKGDYSHAEGYSTSAYGQGAHAEGFSTSIAATKCTDFSTWENTLLGWSPEGNISQGRFSLAFGDYSHTEGRDCLSYGKASHAEGLSTLADGNYSHTEGYGAWAQGIASHAESTATALGDYSHAENIALAQGNYSHAEGYAHAYGEAAHAEGSHGSYNGVNTGAIGTYSHAEGYYTTSSGETSHAEGNYTTASGTYSHAEGNNTTALDYQHAQGHNNNTTNAKAGVDAGTSTGTAFVIGNGTDVAASNAFRITYDGKPYSKSTLTTTGADYAEFFEWQDLNPNDEDRRGYFVTLDGDKIKIAEPDDYILGIISGQPSVVGNGDEDWLGRYVFDDFGAFVYEEFEYEVEVPEEVQEEVVDEETGETTTKTKIVMKTVTKTGTKYKENPDYDPSCEYNQREDRPEWDAVGMLGVLSVRDDGTCKVNGYCKVANGGIATASETGYRVIKRINDNIVKVIFR